MENRKDDSLQTASEEFVDISSPEEYVYVSGKADFVSAGGGQTAVREETSDDIDLVGYEPQYTKKKNRYKKEPKKGGSKKNGSEKEASKGSKKALIITVSAVAAVAVVCVGLWALMANDIIDNPFKKEPATITNEKGEFTYLSGVTVSGYDLSGKTYEQAKELLEKNQDSFVNPFTLTVEANGAYYEFTQEDFTYTFNIEDILNKAKTYCENVADGTAEPAEPSTDSSGNALDMYTVTAVLNSDSVKTAADKIADETDVEAENARVSSFKPFEKEKFEYAEGKPGLLTNREELTENIEQYIVSGKTNGTVTATVQKLEPEINKDMVKKNIVPLSYFTTTSTNTANATSNMGTALDACNGSVIEPGETWSFNACTGNSNLEENGYLPATVISEGRYTTGIGGGLCQASTTIYNAALFANMKIVERYNHLWASSYVPSGFDATIDYPNLDLKLKNTTDYQIFIECGLNGSKLICNIYGYQDPSYDDIMLYSENYDIGSESYSTKSYRVWYKDGNEVDREELIGSNYSLSQGHSVLSADTDGTHLVKPDGSTVMSSSSSEGNSGGSSSSNSGDNSSSRSASSSPASSKPSSSSSSSSSSKPSSSSSSSSKPSSSSSSKPASSSATQPTTEAAKPTNPPETTTHAATENQTEAEAEQGE